VKKLALISINHDGFQASIRLREMIQTDYDIELYTSYETNSGNVKIYHSLDVIIEHLWKTHDFIFFAATGIVVRKIASHLVSKDKDPAVIVMSFDLTMIVPLLSGHLGGANEIAEKISSHILGSKVFITTASDQKNIYSFDLFAKKHSFEIENLRSLKIISSSLIDAKKVHVYSFPSIFQLIQKDFHNSLENIIFHDADDSIQQPSVLIIPNISNQESHTLKLRIPFYFIGIGMNSGTTANEIEDCFLDFLSMHHLDRKYCRGIASFVAKNQEPGLLAFAQKFEFTPVFYEADEINQLEEHFSNSKAEDYFGIKGVAEPCSILLSIYKTLFIKKVKYKNITLAAAF